MTDAELYDVAAQVACVGWLLSQPDKWECVTEHVDPSDFIGLGAFEYTVIVSSGRYHTVGDLVDAGSIVTKEALARWAERISETPVSIARASRRITELAVRRRVRQSARLIAEAAQFTDLGELIDQYREAAASVELPDGPSSIVAVRIDEVRKMRRGPESWIIPGLIARQERVIITGGGGVGKSFLLRQIALSIASGIHPFNNERFTPKRVLILDLENPPGYVGESCDTIAMRLPEANPDNAWVVAQPQIIDMLTREGKHKIHGLCSTYRPDVIIGGPMYRLYRDSSSGRADIGGRDQALRLAEALDDLIKRWDVALVIEGHPPKGGTSASPFGSGVWEWWPDVGFGLIKMGENKTVDPDARPLIQDIELRRFRDDRIQRSWPRRLRRTYTEIGWRIPYEAMPES